MKNHVLNLKILNVLHFLMLCWEFTTVEAQ